jgi:hypothetical protein
MRSRLAAASVVETSDFGPCVLRGEDGRMSYVGAAEIILETREDIDRTPDRRGNRPVVRGARRRTSLGEMLTRKVITKRHHDAATRFLDALSLATGGGSGSPLGDGIRVAPGSRTAMPERQLNAITEVRWVMNHLGLNSDTVFWWVVVGNKSPTEFDCRFRIREGTGSDWLRASLDQLDALYHHGSSTRAIVDIY